VAPVEPWERVWIDAENYAQDIHSLINCTSCHLGQSVDDMDAAHEGMVSSPTDDPVATCGQCHPTITDASVNSLHNTLAGYDDVLYERSLPEAHPAIEEAQTYHCNECHATCGDCHISQPSNVGGGLLEGHEFVREPSMSRNCTACHGSRVKDEYYGAHEGILSDVHFRARMSCNDCHTADEMHGVGMTATHRYDGAPNPACESCHEDQVGIGSGIYQHELHGTEILSCQSCHSTSYTNCTNCHVERSENDVPFFSVESHELDFRLGYNVLRSADRPYMYTTVRHVPIDDESLSYYDVIFANFDAVPTWAHATPHNIQRITPQTESCTACHGNEDVFLTSDVVVPEELAANASVIVDVVPPLPEGYENVITGQENAVAAPEADDAGDGGFWGGGGDDTEAEAEEDAGDSFWGGGGDDTESEADAESDDFWGGGSEDNAEADAEEQSSDDFWGGSSAEPEATATPENPSADDFWGG
jgi:hypothetical protein